MPVPEIERAIPRNAVSAVMTLDAEPDDATVWATLAAPGHRPAHEFCAAWRAACTFPHALRAFDRALEDDTRRVMIVRESKRELRLHFSGTWSLADTGAVVRAFSAAMETALGYTAWRAAYRAVVAEQSHVLEAWTAANPHRPAWSHPPELMESRGAVAAVTAERPPGAGAVTGAILIELFE